MSNPPRAPPSDDSLDRIFDDSLPIVLRHLDREEETPSLFLSIHVGGPKHSRHVRLRLTDPRDPFFLFQASLPESEYGAFKEAHELHVDFHGFPRDLVGMVRDERYGRFFVVDHGDRGVLRIVRRTEFRSLEMLALTLVRQGDGGQKAFLAERCAELDGRLQKHRDECRQHCDAWEERTARLEQRVAELAEERRVLAEEGMVGRANAQSTLAQTVAALKDEHHKELRRVMEEGEKERQRLVRQVESLSAQVQIQGKQADVDVAKLKSQLQESEGRVAALKSKLQGAEDQASLLQQQYAASKKQSEELIVYRENTERQLVNYRLMEVTLTERLNNSTRESASRGEEIQLLRSQMEKFDSHSRTTAQQLSDSTEKVKQLESSLEKARHVMAALHRRNETQRDQMKLLQESVSSNEAWLGEKNNAIEKLQLELAAKERHVQQLEEHSATLRSQLKKSEEEIQQLVQNVKQHEAALVNLHRTQSHFAPRYMATSFKDLARGMQAAPMSSLPENTNVSHVSSTEKGTPRSARTLFSTVGQDIATSKPLPASTQSAYFPVEAAR